MIELVLFIAVGLIPAIVLHEFAHGWVANRLGDPTAKMAGRLTLNPLKHIDLVGTILIPGLLLFAYISGLTRSLFLFGWAKPVPVNFARLKNPRVDMMTVAIAGPIVNVVLALIFAQLIRLGLFQDWQNILLWAVDINLVLALFNLIPIPPLDGSRIVSGILPGTLAREYNRLEPFGIFIVLILLQFGLLRMLYPIVDYLAQALTGVST